ncbi:MULTISPECIES: class I SAM-dependent methyltransferase [Paenibacillus]|uniref:class I SAM-dependent methyltransferase n=1 Tax=Paenibacillus TaxID=44249 RepID=UPI0022B8ECE1|nr:SAM-dependent methyltransferase [Paenibacillus caseinilyticus]MCZ8518753.1 SAM-dependent methyltransferase [Paenibacillus caseinilyticus]
MFFLSHGGQEDGNKPAYGPLLGLIRERMAREGGVISFRDYMQMCLYQEELGYYMREEEKIGRRGDFYTAASVGSLLGESIAAYAAGFAAERQVGWTLAEWGGGSGRLAGQVLDSLQGEYPALYERMTFVSVETSPYHRKLQAAAWEAHRSRVRFMSEEEWLGGGQWPHALVYSNELPDAMPVYRVIRRGSEWHELAVGWDEAAGRLTEVERPVGEGELRRFVEREALPLREGQRFEVPLDALAWLRRLAGSIAAGSTVLTIDYGCEREELYAQHRMNGTLLCYRAHQASDTPLEEPGSRDITSHANFSALIDEGLRSGLMAEALLTQKEFLVRYGEALGKLQDHEARDPFSAAARRNRAIRQLLLSDGMGELFQVLIQKKGEPR